MFLVSLSSKPHHPSYALKPSATHSRLIFWVPADAEVDAPVPEVSSGEPVAGFVEAALGSAPAPVPAEKGSVEEPLLVVFVVEPVDRSVEPADEDAALGSVDAAEEEFVELEPEMERVELLLPPKRSPVDGGGLVLPLELVSVEEPAPKSGSPEGVGVGREPEALVVVGRVAALVDVVPDEPVLSVPVEPVLSVPVATVPSAPPVVPPIVCNLLLVQV